MGCFCSKILNNTPNYLKIGTHVQNYENKAIKSEQIFPGRRLTPQMKDLDEYFHIKQIEKSCLFQIGQYIVSKFVKIRKIVKKFLRAKKAINFQKWLKFYLNMNSRPIFSVLTNNYTIWTNAI